jgi:hypothetical protein
MVLEDYLVHVRSRAAESREVDHARVRAAWGWREFVLSVVVAPSVSAAVYMLVA